jgi:hypothetical protein
MQASVKIVRFWSEFKMDAEGQPVAVDWVEYGPHGDISRTTTCSPVSKLRPAAKDVSQNPVVAYAQALWQTITPAYEAWKKGQNLPETGLPLAAWAGVSPEQIKVLQVNDVRTVEDLADLTDKHITRIPLPGLRSLIENAKRFLASLDATAASAHMRKIEEENEVLKAEMAEIKAMLLKSMAEDDEAKPRRGRPRKSEAVEEEAA